MAKVDAAARRAGYSWRSSWPSISRRAPSWSATAASRHPFPIGRNVHRDGILDLCFVPAAEIAGRAARAGWLRAGERFMQTCGYRGILAIEYFVKGDEDSISTKWRRARTTAGHWTIEGCTTNQFRELARFLLGMPLQEPRLVAADRDEEYPGAAISKRAEAIAARRPPGDVHVHLYGKTREAALCARWGISPSWA